MRYCDRGTRGKFVRSTIERAKPFCILLVADGFPWRGGGVRGFGLLRMVLNPIYRGYFFMQIERISMHIVYILTLDFPTLGRHSIPR